MPNSIYGEYDNYAASLTIKLELRRAIYGNIFLEKGELGELKEKLEAIYNFQTKWQSQIYVIVIGLLKNMGWRSDKCFMNDEASMQFIRMLKLVITKIQMLQTKEYKNYRSSRGYSNLYYWSKKVTINCISSLVF